MKTKASRKFLILAYSLLVLFLVSGCAEVTPVGDCVEGVPYAFLGGLWHGFIAPFSFIISLFMDNVAMYAVNNTGGWYDFGFVLGAGILFGGSGKAS